MRQNGEKTDEKRMALKPIACSQQAAGRITGSVLLILRQISAEYLEIKEAPPVGGASFMLVRHFNCLTGKVK